jgi:hypothetical protein
MPAEHRQITFTLEEITRAVTDLMGHHGVLPAQGRISGLRITDAGDQVAAMVTVVMQDTNKVRELPLIAELLAAALIRLCREARIPLPRSAKKRLVRSGEGVAMHLNIPGVESAVSQKAPVDRLPAAAAAPPSPSPAGVPGAASAGDPSMPDWWSTMSRRGR